jgi:hypothetical protein
MRSHTGGAMSLGRDIIYGTSKQHKLNTKSSTEAELVGVDDVMPQVLWTLYFLESQGYNIYDNILYQDKKSLYYGRPTDEVQVENEQDILRCDIFSSQTESSRKRSVLNIVPHAS